jgi:hypothetical protein
MSDTFTMCFFQWHRGEWRIIDEYTNSGEGLKHYVDYMNELPYRYGTCILPHDVKVRELGTGKTRLRVLQELGVRRIKVLAKLSIADGIEAVRGIMPKLWIDTRCTYLADCLRNYTKEWDEAKGVWKTSPLHDEYSHGADALRYMALGLLSTHKALMKADQISQEIVCDGLSI